MIDCSLDMNYYAGYEHGQFIQFIIIKLVKLSITFYQVKLVLFCFGKIFPNKYRFNISY